MVDIQPIKNQYLTALKERQQIIDKVNEIIRDLNSLNFDDLINLNNKIEEIKTQIAQIESELNSFETETGNALNNKVNKNGDTITGILGIQSTLPQLNFVNTTDDFTVPNTKIATTHYLVNLDKNGEDTSHISEYTYNGGRGLAIVLRNKTTGTIIETNLGIIAEDNGNTYVTSPSWSVGTNDNSDKILTIKMANSLPSLVHTVGNEIIAGNKSFTGVIDTTNSIILKASESNPDVIIRRSGTNGVNMGVFIGDTTYPAMTINTSGKSIAIGSNTVQAYTGNTPTNATGTEIATAGWVITKINELASKNNLNGL